MSKDYINALGLSFERQRRHEDTRINVGGLAINKSNGKGAYGADVGEFIYANNGTYRWNMDDARRGSEIHDNIYQCMAADMYCTSSARLGIRRDVGLQREEDVRSGVQSLARWYDIQFGYQLYRCTSSDRRKNQVIVITVDPDLIVDADTGLKAKDMQLERNIRALSGQTRSTLKQLVRESGDPAKAMLKHKIACLIDECEVDPPMRQIALELLQD
jgi:hypothetical protein